MNHAIDSNTLSYRIYCAQVFRERSSDVKQRASLYALMLYHNIHYGFQEKKIPKIVLSIETDFENGRTGT